LNFEPLSALPNQDLKPIVAFSGRLKRSKRPDHVIKAFELVKEKVPNAELWVFGDGPFRKTLKRLSGSGVSFFGNLDSLKRRELLKKCWVLMVPSVREGWGLNIIEANALGLPAVAYNVPGLCDSVKNNETGLIAERGNIKDLAEKTINLLTDSSLREKLRVNSLNYSKQFSWEKTANELMKLIMQ
jgi:glycosyltransferase involved in cell wall biosynthesis